MIISAGGRTDTVPYYTQWLLNRFTEGYVPSIETRGIGAYNTCLNGCDAGSAEVFHKREENRNGRAAIPKRLTDAPVRMVNPI